jgi:uncharacterized DUF497 family protein
MTDELFEWDADKDAANFRKHGVAFHEAILVFRDPLASDSITERITPRNGSTW